MNNEVFDQLKEKAEARSVNKRVRRKGMQLRKSKILKAFEQPRF